MNKVNTPSSRIWCFDTGMLEAALEAFYQSRQPHDAETREAAAAKVEQILRFLHSDFARQHKLIVKVSRDKGGKP